MRRMPRAPCLRPPESITAGTSPPSPLHERERGGGHSHSRSRFGQYDPFLREGATAARLDERRRKTHDIPHLQATATATRRWMLGQIKCANLKFPFFCPLGLGRGGFWSRSGAYLSDGTASHFAFSPVPPLSLPALSIQRDPLRAFTGRGLDYSKSRSRHPQIIRTTGLR